MNKKVIATSFLIAAAAGVATYIYLKKKREAKNKQLPVSFFV